jgi:hydroxymethylpyrimidine/phosphomethylpyrimidine kinase
VDRIAARIAALRRRTCDRAMRVRTERALRELLLPRAFLITPNVPEAEALSGFR